ESGTSYIRSSRVANAGRLPKPHLHVSTSYARVIQPTVRGVQNFRIALPFGNKGQRCRKRIEEVFGWIKSSAGLAKVKLRGRERVGAAFTVALAAYNLVRLPKLFMVPT